MQSLTEVEEKDDNNFTHDKPIYKNLLFSVIAL